MMVENDDDWQSPTTGFFGCASRRFSVAARWRRIYLQPNTALPIGVADEAVNHSRRHTPKGPENET
jgi:hypothetical protein